jgi:amidohydrolase
MAPTREELKSRIERFIDQISDELIELSMKIHDEPELGHQEFKAAAHLTQFLSRHGMCVNSGTAGMPTAFKATFAGGQTRPTIAFLGEYDALPEIGHACGHNIIGASAAGAGVALASLGCDLSGSVWVLGTPAEETAGGKVPMTQQGVFADVSAVMMMHPTAGESRMGGSSTATHGFTIRYKGRPAHAAGAPQKGINALDAATIFLTSVGLLRQHVPEEVRMHGIITKGGDAANIIPELTEIRYLARAKSRGVLDGAVERVKACIQAGAIATGCEVEVQDRRGYEATKHNKVMARVLREAYERAGVVVNPEPRDGKGSTDLGNVSQVVPQACAYPAIAPDTVAGHSRELCEAAGSDAGHRALIASAKAMAWAAIDLMLDPATLESAWDEFRKSQ